MHSGDSSCLIPPRHAVGRGAGRGRADHDACSRAASGVRGLINLQLAVKDERIWVLEANPRASRTVPFVSKVTGVPLAKVATHVLLGRTLAELAEEGSIPADPHHYRRLPYTAVKAAVLPFGRFPGVDTLLGPEMRSTGEVMGVDVDPGRALAKALGGERGLAPERGHGVRVGREPRQARDPVSRQAPRGPGVPARSRRRGRPACSSARGSRSRGSRRFPNTGAERRRADRRRRGRPRGQHAVRPGPRSDGWLHPNGGRTGGHPVHHDASGRARRAPRDRSAPRCAGRAALAAGATTRSRRGPCRCRNGWRSRSTAAERGVRETGSRRGPERAQARRVPLDHDRRARRSPIGSGRASSSRSRCRRTARSCSAGTSRSTRRPGAAVGRGRWSSCSTLVDRGRGGSPRSRRTSSST